jgi:hypothetical protein
MAASKEDLVFGEIAVKSRLITQSQLEECLEEQKNNPDWKSLGELLIARQYLAPHQLQFLIDIQRRNLELKANQSRRVKQDNLFGRLLMRLGFATDKQIEESLGLQLMINDTHFLRLGEIMVKKGFISDDQLKQVVDFQAQRQVICPGCGQKYNMILFNEGSKIPCYNCDNKIAVEALHK